MKKLLTLGVLFAFPAMASAQEFDNLSGLATSFGGFLNILIGVIITLALVFFLWGLALFILSAGDEEKRSKGKSIMVWGIIALAIMVAVWGIVNFLIGAFDLDTTAPPAPESPGNF